MIFALFHSSGHVLSPHYWFFLRVRQTQYSLHLDQRGAEIVFYDPHIMEYKYEGIVRKGEEALTQELIESADLVIVTTAHTTVDYNFVQRHAKLIFDTKNAMKKVQDRSNIEVL